MSSEQYFGDIQDENKSTINNVGWLYSQKYRLSHEKGGQCLKILPDNEQLTTHRQLPTTNDRSATANNLFLLQFVFYAIGS